MVVNAKFLYTFLKAVMTGFASNITLQVKHAFCLSNQASRRFGLCQLCHAKSS